MREILAPFAAVFLLVSASHAQKAMGDTVGCIFSYEAGPDVDGTYEGLCELVRTGETSFDLLFLDEVPEAVDFLGLSVEEVGETTLIIKTMLDGEMFGEFEYEDDESGFYNGPGASLLITDPESMIDYPDETGTITLSPADENEGWRVVTCALRYGAGRYEDRYDGPCLFRSEGDGNFRLKQADGTALITDMAELAVHVTDEDRGEAFGITLAQTNPSWGSVERSEIDTSCWVARDFAICAY